MDKAEKYGRGPFLGHLCSSLDLGGQPELIRHNTTLIYDCGDFVVRLTPNAFRPKEEVWRELHWMRFVASHTDNVVQVLGDQKLHTQQIEFGGEHFTATLLEKIVGEPVAQEQWGAAHFERIGRLAGFLHRIGQGYVAPHGLELSAWDEAPEASLVDGLPDDHRGLPGLSRRAANHMAAMPRRPRTYGPIHCDIHAGNYLITADDRLVLFDFENSCRAHYINDSAVAFYYAKLHKLTRRRGGFGAPFWEAFWLGYADEYAVPEDEFEHIPWLVLNRSLIVYAYALKIWPAAGRSADQQGHLERIEDSVHEARAALGL